MKCDKDFDFLKTVDDGYNSEYESDDLESDILSKLY
jgi:hypothetical protein